MDSHLGNLGGNVPKTQIESEVRPYLDLLIENGASQRWLQKFYKKNIKYKIIEAINALPEDTLFKQVELLRIFIANQAIYNIKAYQKLIPIRKLFRHSDLLADNLQNELTKQIFISPNQPVYSFLAQDSEKILNSLLGLQVLLEIRERLQKVKNKNSHNSLNEVKEQEVWLQKEIHSRVPLAHRTNETHHSLKLINTKKWDIQKEEGGYDTGPDGMWYFINGEGKLTLFFQREFLKLFALWLDFNEFAAHTFNRKKSFIILLISFIKANMYFGAQLISLASIPYRLLRTAMAEFNQMVFYSLRAIFEYFFPIKHCNKSLLHFASLGMQAVLYFGLILTVGFPYGAIFSFLMISPIQLLTITSVCYVVYNSAALIFGVSQFIFDSKRNNQLTKPSDIATDFQHKENSFTKLPRVSKQKPVYIPRQDQLRVHKVKSLVEQTGVGYPQPKPRLKT